MLGSELSPGWSAETLVKWVIERLGRPVLTDPARPAAYLRSVLVEVFGQAVAPPNPTRRHTERVRCQAETARVALAERQAAARAQLDARDTAAAAATGTGTGRAAARAALARITAQRHTAPSRAAQVDWPEVRLPGSGLTQGKALGGLEGRTGRVEDKLDQLTGTVGHIRDQHGASLAHIADLLGQLIDRDNGRGDTLS